MQKLELTLPSAAENLALDEALLAFCETDRIREGVLRIWEPHCHFVVLGRSSDPRQEANLPACRQQGVPVLRRVSGGGTILAGPGCLMYAVVLSYRVYPELRAIDRAHFLVRQRIMESLRERMPDLRREGTSDLAMGTAEGHSLKFSGNALRAKRTHLLYHGTLLYDFDLEKMADLLGAPQREPEYRLGRGHREFVGNLPLSREELIAALTGAWQATEPLRDWPQEVTQNIVRDKYLDHPTWIIHG